jgi:hypothetical protein
MENDDIISWSKDYLLAWSDFKAEPNFSSFEDSSSQIKYHYTWRVNSETSDGEIYFLIDNIQLSTQFFRHLSWVREKQASLELLKHEQGHFDLAESLRPVITTDFQNEFKDKKFPTRGQNEEQQKQFAREDSGLMIFQKLEKWYYDFSQQRIKYDKETEFGHNLNKQQEYDKKFIKLRE